MISFPNFYREHDHTFSCHDKKRRFIIYIILNIQTNNVKSKTVPICQRLIYRRKVKQVATIRSKSVYVGLLGCAHLFPLTVFI